MVFIAAGGDIDAGAPATADAYRRWLDATLAAETDPARIHMSAADGLRRHLRIARACYREREAGQPGNAAIADQFPAGKTLIVADITDAGSAPAGAAGLDAADCRAFVGVPLFDGDELVGSITASHDAPRVWTTDEVTLIAQTGAAIRGALERVRAAAPRRDSGPNQAALGCCGGQSDQLPLDRHRDFVKRVATTIRGETHAARLPVSVGTVLKAHLDAARVIYADADDDHDVLRVAYDSADGSVRPAVRHSLPPAISARLDRLARGETVATADGRQTGAPDGRAGPLSDDLHASVTVPLIYGGKLVAILAVDLDAPRQWTAGEIAMIEDVAERTWFAVARLRAESARLERRRTQAFLTEWSDAVRQERQPRDVLATTLARLGRHLSVDRLSYAEAAGPGASLMVVQQWGESVVAEPTPFAATGRPAAAEQLSGRPLIVPDLSDHSPLDAADLTRWRDAGVAALVSVPLVRDGAVQAVLCAQSATARRWTDGEVHLIAEVADRIWAILDGRRCEERLAQSEALLAAFMEHAPVGMHLKDGAGRYLRINPELALAMDLPAAEVIGRHPDELFPPDVAERVAAMEAQALAGTPATGEFMAPPRERYASLLSIIFPIAGDHLVKTGGFTLDLTDRKSAEAALQRSRDALYQSEKLSALGSLLAGVSHELNNPLSIVVAQAAMMERQAKGSELAERAFKIRRAADRCARIVQTFLAMARQKKPERTAVDLSTIADAAIELADYGLRADGVGITRVLASDLPRISADGDQLHQIVTNLIVNAQHAMAQSRTLRWLEVRTALGEEPHTVILEVSDSGPGIPLDTRRRIFEPFFTTKPQGEGTGMGLSFSQGLAEAHGGRLTLMPSDTGACFRLTLPIDEHNLLPRVEPAPARPVPLTPRRALIVDDEEEIADSLADFLSIEGFACEVVIGGAAAQRRLAEGGDYDLVVSDLRMPEVDGPALFAWIGDQRPDLVTRTAFTTGDTLGTAAARFLAGAGRPVLEKPFMPDSVRHFLAAAVTG